MLNMTMTELTERYAVHELLSPGDARTGCAEDELHPGEAPGRDIDCVSTGLWFDVAVDGSTHVDAAPLVHRGLFLILYLDSPWLSYSSQIGSSLSWLRFP